MQGFMCATTFVSGGASGVAAKSKLPKMYWYADSAGLARVDRRRFKVIMDCCSSRSHSERGKFGSVDARPALKWFLKACIARFALFARW